MSRSQRKTPIFGNATGSDRWNKRKANRILRRRVREELDQGDWESLPEQREISDPWLFTKDGKSWRGGRAWRHMIEALMRK